MNNQNYGQNYGLGVCKFCGAPNIRSQRTGKVYCQNKCWLQNQPQGNFQPRPAPQKIDWQEISKGKVRHGFSIEAYKLGKQLNFETIREINDWTEFVLTGRLPGIAGETTPPIESYNQPF